MFSSRRSTSALWLQFFESQLSLGNMSGGIRFATSGAKPIWWKRSFIGQKRSAQKRNFRMSWNILDPCSSTMVIRKGWYQKSSEYNWAAINNKSPSHLLIWVVCPKLFCACPMPVPSPQSMLVGLKVPCLDAMPMCRSGLYLNRARFCPQPTKTFCPPIPILAILFINTCATARVRTWAERLEGCRSESVSTFQNTYEMLPPHWQEENHHRQ